MILHFRFLCAYEMTKPDCILYPQLLPTVPVQINCLISQMALISFTRLNSIYDIYINSNFVAYTMRANSTMIEKKRKKRKHRKSSLIPEYRERDLPGLYCIIASHCGRCVEWKARLPFNLHATSPSPSPPSSQLSISIEEHPHNGTATPAWPPSLERRLCSGLVNRCRCPFARFSYPFLAA